jgi:ribosomal protein S18 acetylase RimI-like enzyme
VSNGEKVRVAEPADVAAITETISLAFHDDPTWSWAFPDDARRQAQYAIWWRFLIEGALRFDEPAVFVTNGVEAAAVWLPPGQGELSAEDEERVPGMLRDLVGDRTDDFLELLDRFEAVQPADPPHYYLSLLGVHDQHRGRGIGMDLLRDNIARFDREGVPTYLESSNAANNHRYEALGYRKIGEFNTPDDSAAITAYWRDPG